MALQALAIPLVMAAARVAGGAVAKGAGGAIARTAGAGAANSTAGGMAARGAGNAAQSGVMNMMMSKNEPRKENFSAGVAQGAGFPTPPQWTA